MKKLILLIYVGTLIMSCNHQSNTSIVEENKIKQDLDSLADRLEKINRIKEGSLLERENDKFDSVIQIKVLGTKTDEQLNNYRVLELTNLSTQEITTIQFNDSLNKIFNISLKPKRHIRISYYEHANNVIDDLLIKVKKLRFKDGLFLSRNFQRGDMYNNDPFFDK